MYKFNPRLSVRIQLSASHVRVLFLELCSVFLETVHGAVLVLESLKGHHTCQTLTTPAAYTSPERGRNTDHACLLYCGPTYDYLYPLPVVHVLTLPLV